MLTPQQLMDIPKYGMAEKALRKQKQWRLDPSEKLAVILDQAQCAIDQVSSSVNDVDLYIYDLEQALEGNT